MTQATDAAAVIAAVNAKFASVRAYDMSDPDASALTTDHILVSVTRRYVADRQASGEVTIPGGRVVTRYVAKTIGNLYVLRQRVTEALEDVILPGGVGPFVFETSDPPGPDDGWISAADTWTY